MTAPNGEHKRPSVLYAVGSEGSKRRGPTYLIHKHSRCHAFSIFQGYQVTGQKILASHAMLLSNKAIQFSFANSPEHKSSSKQQQRPHEPYENDPEVMKLQTHNLMEDDPDTPEPHRHQHPDIKPLPVSPPKPTPMRHTPGTPERNLSRKPSNDVLRSVPRTGPSSFAVTEANRSPKAVFAETDDSVTSTSTLTPAPRITPHAVAFDAMTDHPMTGVAPQPLSRAPTNKFEWIKRAFGTGRPVGTAARIQGHGPPSASLDGTYSPPWLLMAPQSVKQEEERIIQGLNDSFRAVGLIPQPKVRPTPSTRPKRPKPRSPFLDPIPRDAMMMLMPLWIAEGGHAGGIAKHHVPMTERTYLLVYYVPFDSSGRSGDSVSSGKKRTRRDRDRSDRADRKKPTSAHGRPRLEPTDEERRNAPTILDLPPKKPKKVAFRVVAQMLSYADVRECGIKLPRFGLAVHGSLSDALLGNPMYHARGENYPAVVAVCHGAEAGLELVTEGLDKLGLRRNKAAIADEQQIALAAMEMDADALEEELQARQQPLTPIGKSVVEMIFAGCVSILEVGFR